MWNKKPSKLYLFIYTVEGRNGFWTFNGRQYCRFVVLNHAAYLMRVQPNLPAMAEGFCTEFEGREMRSLRRAAERAGVALRFCATELECELAAARDRPAQVVYGQAQPAGSFRTVDEESGQWIVGSG